MYVNTLIPLFAPYNVCYYVLGVIALRQAQDKLSLEAIPSARYLEIATRWQSMKCSSQ